VHFHHIVEPENAIDDRLERAARKALVTYSTATFRRASSPVTSRMLYPLTVGILRIISSTGIGVSSSLSAP
jgi:hypothetical protein